MKSIKEIKKITDKKPDGWMGEWTQSDTINGVDHELEKREKEAEEAAKTEEN